MRVQRQLTNLRAFLNSRIHPLYSSAPSGRHALRGFAGLVACGGFSYGDVLGAGEGWAKSILFNEALREEFQAFFDLLQQYAEEQSLMSIHEARLDRVVHIKALSLFAENFISGFVSFLSELGFKPDIPLDN